MSPESYLVKANATGQEIRWDFPREQVQQLHNLLREKGYREYIRFVREHLEDTLKYISLSRSQREKKKWANHPDILLIRCAALQICDASGQLLDDILPIADIVNRGSYREFHSVITRGLAPLLLSLPFAKFPFDGFESPFS